MKLHVGSGTVVLKDWINMDLKEHSNNSCVKHDVRTRFPYEENTVNFIFSEHFIEHLTFDEGIFYLKEAYRILKPKGVIRTSTFDIDIIIINIHPDRDPVEWQKYKDSLYNGAFSHMTRAEMINDAAYNNPTYNDPHKHLYNIEELVKILKFAGFSNFNFPKIRENSYFELKDLEYRCNSDCIVEAIK